MASRKQSPKVRKLRPPPSQDHFLHEMSYRLFDPHRLLLEETSDSHGFASEATYVRKAVLKALRRDNPNDPRANLTHEELEAEAKSAAAAMGKSFREYRDYLEEKRRKGKKKNRKKRRF